MGRVNKYIKEGDVVLISGLYGDDVKFANNKLGYVKEIMTITHGVSLNFAAFVLLDLNIGVPVNFLYLYNIKTLEGVDEILIDTTFIPRYLKSKKAQQLSFVQDTTGNHNLMVFGVNKQINIFTISTLN